SISQRDQQRPLSILRNGRLWNASPETKLLRFDTCELDHLGPLLGFVCDHLGELSRRSRQRLAAEVSGTGLHLGVVESRVGPVCTENWIRLNARHMLANPAT